MIIRIRAIGALAFAGALLLGSVSAMAETIELKCARPDDGSDPHYFLVDLNAHTAANTNFGPAGMQMVVAATITPDSIDWQMNGAGVLAVWHVDRRSGMAHETDTFGSVLI